MKVKVPLSIPEPRDNREGKKTPTRESHNPVTPPGKNHTYLRVNRASLPIYPLACTDPALIVRIETTSVRREFTSFPTATGKRQNYFNFVKVPEVGGRGGRRKKRGSTASLEAIRQNMFWLFQRTTLKEFSVPTIWILINFLNPSIVFVFITQIHEALVHGCNLSFSIDQHCHLCIECWSRKRLRNAIIIWFLSLYNNGSGHRDTTYNNTVVHFIIHVGAQRCSAPIF